MVFWNSIPSSVSKEDVTHRGFAAMQLDGEARSCRRCHGDALARRLLSQEAAHVSLPSPLPFGLRSSLPPSPQNVDEQKQHVSHRTGKRSPVSRAAGRKGSAALHELSAISRCCQACSGKTLLSFTNYKKNSWQQLSVTQLQKNHLRGEKKKKEAYGVRLT